ncbi:MAG: type VI secretion system tube protein Hcp [Candidatus Cohnella colombiensis]|uniref:Type VI secretion system tube protein Hcp n=1 Tax=Candidatus Cohnella colombiensis TaxID=3121368 RepID=A0AA95EV06_9BACL|nr:MAG: type VI secretion system tube protein Hcp [Cohnella sp.]
MQPSSDYDVYLKLDGILGDSTAVGYEKWIVLSNVQFDLTNTSRAVTGGGGGSGKATIDNFTVTKFFDSSSIALFQSASSGANIKSAKIVFVNQGERSVPFLTITLNSINVSEYNFNNVYETINLKFNSIQFSYSPTDSRGQRGNTNSGGWDFSQNKKL